MTVSKGPRFGLTRWSDDADGWTREDWDDDNRLVEELGILGTQGPAGARPAVGMQRRLYLATDAERLYLDDGDEWLEVLIAGTATASAIAVTPVGTVAATDVQAAIAELDTEKAPKASPTFTGAPATTPAAATDLATALTLVNYLRTRLLANGLIA